MGVEDRALRRLINVAAVAVTAASAAAIHAPAPTAAAAAQRTDARDARGPLDLTEASLEQRDVRMFLRVATAGPWTHAELRAGPQRTLCVTLAQGSPAVARARLCVTGSGSRPTLTYTALAADGAPLRMRRLAARVAHPAHGLLEASFLPAAAGLRVGPYSWSVQSAWTDAGECAATCTDRLPDGGEVAADLGLLGVPPCFGAAARDPSRPCDNPDLRLAVQPPPSRAKVLLDPYCDRRTHPGLLTTCAFGAAAGEAAGTFALIGDSHAASMKAPLEVVTLAKRWRGISIVRAACPATQAAAPVLPTRERSRQCVQWNRDVIRWLNRQPAVQTVFLAAHAGAKVAPRGGRGMFATARAGYRDEIRRLLRTVRRVVVIRDVPKAADGHVGCVAALLEAGRPVGSECSQERGRAIRRDPLVAAARATRSPRVTVVDLTNHFCDEQRCLAVVGGALVHHDETHMTTAFSPTLGPFILRALDR
ncbi:MAG: hypothetical protein AVDCRST_MAG67-703 [uncultured Solirubrobacteraceae bacterium]|uniref:SGNH domain-containing protein n=1 Tax=uncultured Solirubrobacteraceae bacterium TaxID=1162706 RepID=A0A6J4RPJ6_9ACTN|nr:MAG: hypothetical protein AVDCRST_MAG67-703 [uncultured Solirubrobacteraceae bacterium]